MRKTADVRSIDALKSAKAALIEFREIIAAALYESYADVQRTVSWLKNDQAMYWKREQRRRAEQVAQAKSELYRAQLEAGDERPLATEQKKLVEQAERRLQEADDKIKAVRNWSRLLERELTLFKGHCQPVARAIELEIPKGEARLEQIIRQLEAYVSVNPPRAPEEPAAPRTDEQSPSPDTAIRAGDDE